MNYIGSISILDRGDAPAQAVIDRNARSLAQRIADETKDELEKVMTRVETIYTSFEMSDHLYSGSNLEYVQDINELEELMKDQVKKRKYQQQVTIFIVGFSEVSGQKFRLLQQVNQFFTENSKKIDEEDWFPTTPDMDLEEVGEKIEDSLQTAKDLSKRLGEINREMIEFMASYAEKKASNKLTQMVEGKGKKKIEKALNHAKDEVQSLHDKLVAVQTELEEKDEKLQTTFKQLESKNLEVQKFRTAAELAKKAVQDTETLKEEISRRDAKIAEHRQRINQLELDLAQSVHMKEQSQTKLTSVGEEIQQKMILLQKEMEEQKQTSEDVKRELDKLHSEEMAALTEVHARDMEQLKSQHDAQIKSLMDDLQKTRVDLAEAQRALQELETRKNQAEGGTHLTVDSEANQDNSSRQSSKQKPPLVVAIKESKKGHGKNKESRPSTKDTGKSGKGSGSKKLSKSPARDKGGNHSYTTGAKSDISYEEDIIFYSDDEEFEPRADKEYSEVAIQDEGGDHNSAFVEENKIKTPATRNSRRSKSTLETVHEAGDFEDSYDLNDEQAWASLPKDQVQGRFAQYRHLCQQKLQEVEEQQQLTIAKTQRKVQQLKAQFVEHKSKWEAERKILVEQLEQVQKLHTDAEKEADAAMTHLEDFIIEQEKLEEQEEVHRSSHSLGAQTPASSSSEPLTSMPMTGVSHQTPSESRTADIPELQNLLKQTDDAKVEEMNARSRATGVKSAPPAVDMITKAQVTIPQLTNKAEELNKAVIGHKAKMLEHDSTENLKDLNALHPPSTVVTVGFVSSTGPLTTPPGISEKLLTDLSKKDNPEMEIGNESVKGSVSLEESISSEADLTEQFSGRQEEIHTIDNNGRRQSSVKSQTSSHVKTPESILKIERNTKEELRASSANTLASLRSVYKSRLEDARQAAEDRRSKSPHIALPTKSSLDDELIVDENDVDEDIMLLDDLKSEYLENGKELSSIEIGTSPPPGPFKDLSLQSIKLHSRKSVSLSDHPLLQEYLKSYDGIVNFKENLSKMFLDKDMMSASQIVADLEKLIFDKEKQVMPQVEQHTSNALYMLDEIAGLLNSILINDREPTVSSLRFSRDEVRTFLPPGQGTPQEMYSNFTNPKMTTPVTDSSLDKMSTSKYQDEIEALRSSDEPAGTAHKATGDTSSQAGSRKSSISETARQQFIELQEQCYTLQSQLNEEAKKHEEQLRHNTVVMMEMQDTINELQRELSALGKSTRKTRSASSSLHGGTQKALSPDQSLMFTRLDMERNAKIMKRAVLEERLHPEKYKEVVSTMDEYANLPGQRLTHLVRKYVHHSRMKEIEENVKNSQCLDEKVFDTLDKMEALQNQRARHWAEKMDSMGLERLKLAAMLMDSLDSIEQESGLFLIKPMYSYRGRELKAPPTQKLARPVRAQPLQRHASATQESVASFAPAPTPASNLRRLDRHTPVTQVPGDIQSIPPPPPSRPEDGVVGSVAIRNVATPQTPQLMQTFQTWNISASQPATARQITPHILNTPRMLELDINRMLIGQNNISAKLPHPPTDDRLLNAANNSLRSYITVNRPTAAISGDRSYSTNGNKDQGVPPSSPSVRLPVTVSPVDRDLPMSMTTPPPLPPIGDQSGSPSSMTKEVEEEAGDQSGSPSSNTREVEEETGDHSESPNYVTRGAKEETDLSGSAADSHDPDLSVNMQEDGIAQE